MGNTNKLSIAHIINPVVLPSNSDLFIAQPITFETMRIAGDYAKNIIDIEFYSAQYQEDRPIVPGFITKTVDLNRSILDIAPTICKRKLPFIKDILDRLYDSSKADYFIYTNVDIALAKDFYIGVSKIIKSGYVRLLLQEEQYPAILKQLKIFRVCIWRKGSLTRVGTVSCLAETYIRDLD